MLKSFVSVADGKKGDKGKRVSYQICFTTGLRRTADGFRCVDACVECADEEQPMGSDASMRV